jgi:hypothetical protein
MTKTSVAEKPRRVARTERARYAPGETVANVTVLMVREDASRLDEVVYLVRYHCCDRRAEKTGYQLRKMSTRDTKLCLACRAPALARASVDADLRVARRQAWELAVSGAWVGAR